MGDDFDLFPKRENLDPFSFGKKEKTTDPGKPESGEDLFGEKEQSAGSMPDLSPLSPDTPEVPPPLPDLPLGGEEPAVSPPASGSAPSQPPHPPGGSMSGATPDLTDSILADGPISEEKTFDEPVFEQQQIPEEAVERGSRKSPSPFVVIGGALIIIIGLLYGALTYLKRDKPPVSAVSAPPVSVAVVPSSPEPVAPVPEPGTSDAGEQTGARSPVETEPAAVVESRTPEPETATVQEPALVQEPLPVREEPAAEPGDSPVAAAGAAQFSLQMGAFILDTSVADLEKKLRAAGYEPFMKKGSTTAMMNMLTVGPFGNAADARAALSRLNEAGVDTNMRRRDDGSAIINAGSYLLEENAASVMKKIRSLGYPVKLYKSEARLPMTFVRVGRYRDMDEATTAKKELKAKGLDGIVVKLQ